jgi:1,4-dihydroxy-2-naphthoate octaprenyltransferase
MARSLPSALLRAARPLAHANLAPPILFGQALAYAQAGRFSLAALAYAQIFGVIDHLLIVFVNDLADAEADAGHDAPTPFSGGSRVLVDGDLSRAALTRLAWGAGLALLLVGGLGAALSPWQPVLALAAVALIGAYSLPPLRLSYRGGGELLQGLGVGVVLPLVGATAQGARVDGALLAVLAPGALLAVAGNVLTSIPDERADRAAGKGSPAARWGGVSARWGAVALHVSALALGAMVIAPGVGGWGIAAAGLALGVASLAAFAGDSRRDVLAFVVLGGATESIAWLGWAALLVASR